jgi:hypothetical protein
VPEVVAPEAREAPARELELEPAEVLAAAEVPVAGQERDQPVAAVLQLRRPRAARP